MRKELLKFIKLLRRHWLMIVLITVGLLIQLCTIIQFLYPSNRLLPLQKIDNVFFGGWQKTDAIKRLDSLYLKSTVSIYLGGSKEPYLSPILQDIGISASNIDRITNYQYPWYLRLVPTSIIWGQYLMKGDYPTYTRDQQALSDYIDSHFDETGEIAATNATLRYDGKNFVVVSGQNGGSFKVETVSDQLASVKPLVVGSRTVITSNETEPIISDAMAKQFGEQMVIKVGSGVSILVKDEQIKIPASNILGWIDFGANDGNMTYSLSAVKAADYMEEQIAPKVMVAAGVTVVTSYDFNEVSRVAGKKGEGLDVVATLESIKLSIEDSKNTAKAVTMVVEPTVSYKRGYSSIDEGIVDLIKQYADTEGGISSVSFVELSGDHRRALYNSDQAFVSASTYKLFVAYSVLTRIENSKWKWTDNILSDGRNLETCFDDMIVNSDNECAEAIAGKAGWSNVTNEAHSIGCDKTSLSNKDGYAKTSSADLALFLAQLQTGQILKEQSSRDLLINAMKRNVYREGIPTGISWVVADKVGFINGALNDAAIIYTPTGTYVLVIMTDGSSWAVIAELAGKIEAMRAE